MKKKKVVVCTDVARDSWFNLFVAALRQKTDVTAITLYRTCGFRLVEVIEGEIDVLTLVLKDVLRYSAWIDEYRKFFPEVRIVLSGYRVLLRDVPEGVRVVSQVDFSSEDELINAILG